MPNPRPAASPGRPVKFPDSKDRSINETGALCTADRVLALYNQAHPEKGAVKIGAAVRSWFEQEARRDGWVFVRWFKDVATDHGAGCVLATVMVQLVPLTEPVADPHPRTLSRPTPRRAAAPGTGAAVPVPASPPTPRSGRLT